MEHKEKESKKQRERRKKLDLLESFIFFSDEVLDRHFDVIKFNISRAGGPEARTLHLAGLDSFGSLNQQQRNAAHTISTYLNEREMKQAAASEKHEQQEKPVRTAVVKKSAQILNKPRRKRVNARECRAAATKSEAD
jgi:hypothetical protein